MFECASLMSQHACGERSDRVQGLSALARFQGARSPLAESEAAPQVDPGKAPAQKSATKLRCFARCERRGECRGAVKGSIALQFRSTMIDRSRRHRLNASCQCCRLGEARPFRGAVFLRIRATDRAGSPSESSIRFVSWSFRPQTASGGRGASPPDPRPAGCRCRRRLRRLDLHFIISSANFSVVPPAGCLRRPGRFAPGPQTGRVPPP